MKKEVIDHVSGRFFTVFGSEARRIEKCSSTGLKFKQENIDTVPRSLYNILLVNWDTIQQKDREKRVENVNLPWNSTIALVLKAIFYKNSVLEQTEIEPDENSRRC